MEHTPGAETSMLQHSCYYFDRLKSIGLGRERTTTATTYMTTKTILYRCIFGVFGVAGCFCVNNTVHEASMRCVTYNKSKQKKVRLYYAMIYAACRYEHKTLEPVSKSGDSRKENKLSVQCAVHCCDQINHLMLRNVE